MNRYLVKIASKLRPQQEEALSQLDKEKGIILHHSTGSGKTLTYLEAIRRAQEKDKKGRVFMAAPASLISNVDKEIKKHKIKIDMDRLDLRTYDKARIESDQLSKNKYILGIADEAHRLRNKETQRTKALAEIFSNSEKRLLGTATAQYNHMADLAPLVNIAANKKLLPEDRKEMLARYTKTTKNKPTFAQRILRRDPGETTRLKNHEELKGILGKYIHHYDVKDDPDSAKKFPTKAERFVEVAMSPEQVRMYKFLEGDIPWLTKMKIRNNLPLDKKEKANLNAFSSGIRQASNAVRHFSREGVGGYTPKIDEAYKNLDKAMKEDKNFRGLIYSNFLDAGVHEYSRKLTENGIDHHVYTGGLTQDEKDVLVKDYNEGGKKVLIISSSGAEGLDLKGTKKIQIMEPHFNSSKIRQVVGRGVRFESHEHLPENERHVDVEHYVSTLPKPMLGKAHFSIDKYLTQNSDDKQNLFDSVKELMK